LLQRKITSLSEKVDMECKFWMLVDEVEIKEEFAFNLIAPVKNRN
jgi:hypothetical protein